MKTRAYVSGLLLCVVMLTAGQASGATVTLKNDNYTGGTANLYIYTGLHAKEGIASILIPPSYPFKIQKVRAIIAGSTKATKFTFKIFQDTPGSKIAGIKLYEEEVTITPSSTAISEVDVSSKSLSISSGHIRVAIYQSHKGAPSIVRDKGPRTAKRNLVWGYPWPITIFNWYWMSEADPQKLINGNWIIRVVGETSATIPDMGTPDQKVTTPDQKVTPKDQKVTQQDLTASPDQTSTKKDGGVTKKDGGGPATGSEGGACFPNDTCNAGLSCLSKLCVKAPEPESSSGCSVGPADLGDPRLLLLLALVGATVLLRRRRR